MRQLEQRHSLSYQETTFTEASSTGIPAELSIIDGVLHLSKSGQCGSETTEQKPEPKGPRPWDCTLVKTHDNDNENDNDDDHSFSH